ncbi:DUF6069 family protein [Nocardiopsis sp. CNT312]|uniref:DUF6069 family protein n=1 Tax=Nocardiopsis sp. CNT312 TaxID=1137268 RepID=UPI00048B7FD1|nr:DUF6069 family protein [Nocardiopsis sp. CNT312]
MAPTAPDTTTARRGAWKPRLIAIAAAAVVNVLAGAAAPLVGADLVISPPGQEEATVPLTAFALFTVAFGLIGWGTLALAERFLGRRGLLVWTVVALVFAVLSCVPSLAAGGSAATGVLLAATHLLAAAVMVPVFRRSSPTD